MVFLAPIGGLLLLVGAIWLIVLSVQTGATTGEKVLWALVNFFCQPISGIVFFFVKKQGLVPVILVIIGSILYGVGFSAAMGDALQQMPR